MGNDTQRNSLSLALILAFLWGAIWAAFLQFTKLGRWLARERTWITVVVGVGIDLVIASLAVARDAWLRFGGLIAASSLPIILRSVVNEYLVDDE